MCNYDVSNIVAIFFDSKFFISINCNSASSFLWEVFIQYLQYFYAYFN